MALFPVELVAFSVFIFIYSRFRKTKNLTHRLLQDLQIVFPPTDEDFEQITKVLKGKNSGSDKYRGNTKPKKPFIKVKSSPIGPEILTKTPFYTEVDFLLMFAVINLGLFLFVETYKFINPAFVSTNLFIYFTVVIAGLCTGGLMSITTSEGYFSYESRVSMTIAIPLTILSVLLLIVFPDVLDLDFQSPLVELTSNISIAAKLFKLPFAFEVDVIIIQTVLVVFAGILSFSMVRSAIRFTLAYNELVKTNDEQIPLFVKFTFHINFIMPLLISIFYLRAILDSSEWGNLTTTAIRLIVIAGTYSLRLLLMRTEVQIYLNQSYDYISSLLYNESKQFFDLTKYRIIINNRNILVVSFQCLSTIVLVHFLFLGILNKSGILFAVDESTFFQTPEVASFNKTAVLTELFQEGNKNMEEYYSVSEMRLEDLSFALNAVHKRGLIPDSLYVQVFSFLIFWINLAWFLISAIYLGYVRKTGLDRKGKYNLDEIAQSVNAAAEKKAPIKKKQN